MTRLLSTALVIVGLVMLVLIVIMFVDTEQTIQKTQIIEKTNPLYNVLYQSEYLYVRPINGFMKGFLDKHGAGYGMAFHCELTFIQL